MDSFISYFIVNYILYPEMRNTAPFWVPQGDVRTFIACSFCASLFTHCACVVTIVFEVGWSEFQRLHSGIWTWELRTPDRLQACSPRSPLCLAFMTWKTDLRLQWIFLSPPNINHIISDNIICGRDGLGEGRLAMATSGRWKFAFFACPGVLACQKNEKFYFYSSSYGSHCQVSIC